MLRGKSGNFRNFFFHNNIIFHNLYLFLPATYTLRVLIDAPQLINFLIFFAPISSPLLIPTPLFILFSNSLETKKFFSFTLTDIHARYYQILLIFLTLIVVWGYFYTFIQRGQTDIILAKLFKFHPIRFSSSFIKYLEKFQPTHLSPPPIY